MLLSQYVMQAICRSYYIIDATVTYIGKVDCMCSHAIVTVCRVILHKSLIMS